MATGKAKMKILQEQRDRLLSEMEALRNKIAGLEMAMALLNDDPAPASNRSGGSSKVNVKGTILDLLEKTGTTGLNAQSAVEMARARGVILDKASVSSILSRFKRDEVVVHDGERYKLKQFARVLRVAESPVVN